MHSSLFRIMLFTCLLVGFAHPDFAQRTKKRNHFENLLVGTSWKADGIPFESSDRETYQLTTYDPLIFEGRYGNFIDFDTTTFSTHYSAPCGNDCFTQVTGEYKFVRAFTVQVKVISISRYGFCGKDSETLNKNMGDYLLERSDTGWKLTKVKE